LKTHVATATLAGDRLIVWDPAEGSRLYRLGFYGKPVGISKPKTADFDKPLILDLLEGFYLYEKGIITVVDQVTGQEASREELLKRCREAIDCFDEKYLVYKDLRDKGYDVAEIRVTLDYYDELGSPVQTNPSQFSDGYLCQTFRVRHAIENSAIELVHRTIPLSDPLNHASD